MDFRWNEWNEDHVASHGVLPEEAEAVVESARRPFPRKIDNDKWLAWGRGAGGRLLQVVFLVEEEDSACVVHARPLTDREKRRFRQRE